MIEDILNKRKCKHKYSDVFGGIIFKAQADRRTVVSLYGNRGKYSFSQKLSNRFG